MVEVEYKSTQISAKDNKDHYTAIVLGAGVSGLASIIQFKRQLGLTDVMCYEKTTDVGGTWNVNRYPGAACDIPMAFYSFSFAHPRELTTQWAGQAEVLSYLHGVQKKFEVNNICFQHLIEESRFSRETGLWTVKVKDLKTGKTRTRTCNILVSAAGGLARPNDPTFDVRDFNGDVMHSAQWNFDVSLKDKDVVIVGNGCSASQIVPEIVKDVKSVTQIARSRQSILSRMPIPDNWFVNWMMRYFPGFSYFFRTLIFLFGETTFKVADLERGAKMRLQTRKELTSYIKSSAPEKYHEWLEPDFEIATKRRVFDSGYYEALHSPKVNLIQDDALETVKGDTVKTKKGVEIKADVIVLCTGFKIQEFLSPLKIVNDEGVELSTQLSQTNAGNYQGTLVAGFPNFFYLMGPNTATGHSSVIFTTECQISMMLKLVKPVLAKVEKADPSQPAPMIEVSRQAQNEYMSMIRTEMKRKVWEHNGGNSWYVNNKGVCTTLYPFSQVHFWRHATWPNMKSFIYSRT